VISFIYSREENSTSEFCLLSGGYSRKSIRLSFSDERLICFFRSLGLERGAIFMRKTFVRGFIVLGAGTAAVGGYLLLFLPWQHKWGATDEEVHRRLPGDDQIPHPHTQWTRAITVKAKAAAIWPWLIQMGWGRGGSYSYPWLEKLMGLKGEDTDQINPAWQHLKAGEILPAESDGSGYRVIMVEPDRVLVIGAREKDEAVSQSCTHFYPAFTWTCVLEERAHEQTRLLMRMRAHLRSSPLLALASLFINFGTFL